MLTNEAIRYFLNLAEWDWLITENGEVLHAPHIWLPEDDYPCTEGTTACGYQGKLHIPGMFTRMGAKRCKRCCTKLGYPTGIGSPKNDISCREFVEKRIRNV